MHIYIYIIYIDFSIYLTLRYGCVRCGWRRQRDADGRWTQGQQRSVTRCQSCLAKGDGYWGNDGREMAGNDGIFDMEVE